MIKKINSLKKQERLRGSLRFKVIKEEGRCLKGNRLIFNVAPNNLNINRIGVVISSHTAPKSSSRNRYRRLIREAYRIHKSEPATGFDIIVRLKKIDRSLDFKTVERDILYLFKELKLLR